MPKYNYEDVIGWYDETHYYCEDCSPEDANLKPILIDQFDDEEVIITCDCCNARIV